MPASEHVVVFALRTALAWGIGDRVLTRTLDGSGSEAARIRVPMPRRGATGTIAFINAKIVTMSSRGVVERGTLVVANDTIAGEPDRLESHLLQTRAGSPTYFMVTGERGIGKTSLLNYFQSVTQGELPVGLDYQRKVKFLVIDVDVDQATTQLRLIRKTS